MAPVRSELLRESERILAEFFNRDVGLSVVDAEFRCRAVNPYLAASNKLAPELHIGKHFREILGATTAAQFEPALKQVFATGKPILNHALAGPLPSRPEGGHWIDNLFPIVDSTGKVEKVGIVTVELDPSLQIHAAQESRSCLLRSWKDIARYMGACVKTVQRWEQNQGLPVRRLTITKGSVVFALTEEIETWLKNRTES